MEHLKDTEKFIVYKKEEDLPLYMSKFVSWVERFIFNRISKRVNFLLTRINDQKLEIIADGNTDKNEDGNWRISESSGDLIVQKRINGTWTTAETYHGS